MEDGQRSFTTERSSVAAQKEHVNSRYISRNPMSAGKKAARVLFRNHANKSDDKIYIQIRETTRGSKDATFFYEATRTKVNKKRKVGGKEIKITQEIEIKSADPAKIESKFK
jgi:hypothetical protein